MSVPDIVATLRRYAYARDRNLEREPRTITMTDDEAVELLDLFDAHNPMFPEDER